MRVMIVKSGLLGVGASARPFTGAGVTVRWGKGCQGYVHDDDSLGNALVSGQ